MINFFRKIRQKLLSEGKLLKYLKYALGEIVLVVIGILIALQINNWNESRKNSDLEKLYITRLIDDIEEEQSYVDSYLEYNYRVLDFANQASLYFLNPSLALDHPEQSLIELYQASQISDARATTSAYKELYTTGQINLFKDYDLRMSIISFYELNWTRSVTFNFPNNYRESLRSQMPNAIQQIIRSRCADIYIETKNSIAVQLPEVCEIEVDENLATTSLKNLLRSNELETDLNFLIGNIQAKIAYLNNMQTKINDVKSRLIEYQKTIS